MVAYGICRFHYFNNGLKSLNYSKALLKGHFLKGESVLGEAEQFCLLVTHLRINSQLGLVEYFRLMSIFVAHVKEKGRICL